MDKLRYKSGGSGEKVLVCLQKSINLNTHHEFAFHLLFTSDSFATVTPDSYNIYKADMSGYLQSEVIDFTVTSVALT